MIFASFLFMLVLGIIASIAVAASLLAPIAFSPFVFPFLFVTVSLAVLLAAPRLRAFFSPPDALASGVSDAAALLRDRWLFVILVPVILLLLFVPGVQFGYHGLFHSGYVYDILLRGLPPENVTLPGAPANDYWPYHLYLALLARIFNAPPPFVSALSNILLLGMALLWMSAIWKTHRLETPSAFDILFPLLGANLFYLLNFLLAHWLKLPAEWQPDVRLDLPLIRFVNFNGFSLGILFFLAALFIALRILREGETLRDATLLIFLGGSAILFHATTGVYLFAALIPSLIAARLLDRARPLPSASSLARSGFTLAGWIFSTGLFLLPAALFLLRSAAAMGAKTTLEPFSSQDIASIFVMTYPAIPFFVIGTRQAWNARQASTLFLAILSLWGFLLAFFIALPDANEYKFIHLSSIAFLMVALAGLKEFASHSARWGRAVLAVALIALVANTLFGSWATYDTYSRRHNLDVSYRDTHVTLEQADFKPFAWIRDNAPPDTIVIQPLTSKDWNYGYFSERLPYVVAGHIYNENIPETAIRVEQMKRLYDPAAPVAERIAIVDATRQIVKRPVAVVYFADPAFRAAMQARFGVAGEAVGGQIYIFLLDAP